MARIVVLAGRTRDDRRRHTARLEVLDAHQRPTWLYLTSTVAKAEHVREAFWRQPDKPPAFLPDAQPIGRWLEEMGRRFGDGRVPLGTTARSLLAGAVWRSVRPQLTVWGRLPDGPALRAALLELVEGWALGFEGTRPPPLPQDPAQMRLPGETTLHPALTPALRSDAALVLGAWRQALERSPGWTDRAGAARALLRALKSGDDPGLQHYLRTLRSVVVDDVLALPPLEAAVLDAFVDAYDAAMPHGEVRLCVEAGHPDARGPDEDFLLGEGLVVDPASEASRPLRRRWGRRIVDGQADADLEDADPDRLDLADLLALDGHAEDVGRVRVRRYGSEQAECVALARQLRHDLLSGLPARDCAVAVPGLARYLPLLRSTFDDFGIPWHLAKGEDLAISPPVSAARRLLSLAADGVDRDGLRALVASRWIRAWRPAPSATDLDELASLAFPDDAPARDCLRQHLGAHEGRERPPSFRWLWRELIESGADGPSPRAWLPRVAALRRAAMRAAGTPEPPAGRSGEWSALARLAVDIWGLAGLVAHIDALAATPDAAGASDRFAALLPLLGLVETAQATGADPVRSSAVRANRDALRRLHELIAELRSSLRAVEAATAELGGGVGLLRDALDEQVRRDAYRSGQQIDGVRIAGLPDVHGLDVPWLWVAGLVDSDFPKVRPPSFLLPGSGLLPSVDDTDLDRARFASLLRNAGHGGAGVLYLSTPATVEGAAALPSAPVQDLLALRCADGTLAERWAEQQRAEEAALPPFVAPFEVLGEPARCPREAAVIRPWARPVDRNSALSTARRQEHFGAFDGVLASGSPYRPAVLGWLAQALRIEDGALTLGTTRLERFAGCPMRFFFESVLGLREPRPWSDEPDAADAGELIHGILHRFFAERIESVEQGQLPRASLENAGEGELRGARRHLARVAREVAAEHLRHRRGPWVERFVEELLAGLDEAAPPWAGRLLRFLQHEAVPFLGLEPAELEWSFPPVDVAAAAHQLDGGAPPGDLRVLLRGQADRVDRGEGVAGARVAVLDYKTGAAPDVRKVDEGLSFQPVVYAAAAARPLQAEGTIAGYREVPRTDEYPRRRMLGDPAVLQELQGGGTTNRFFYRAHRFDSAAALSRPTFAASLRRAAWYGQLVASGVFPTTLAGPDRAGCSRCDFRRSCRLDALANAERVAQPGHWLPAPVAATPPGDEA